MFAKSKNPYRVLVMARVGSIKEGVRKVRYYYLKITKKVLPTQHLSVYLFKW